MLCVGERNMKHINNNNFSKKAMVFGIIMLFFGASIVPNISGDPSGPFKYEQRWEYDFDVASQEGIASNDNGLFFITSWRKLFVAELDESNNKFTKINEKSLTGDDHLGDPFCVGNNYLFVPRSNWNPLIPGTPNKAYCHVFEISDLTELEGSKFDLKKSNGDYLTGASSGAYYDGYYYFSTYFENPSRVYKFSFNPDPDIGFKYIEDYSLGKSKVQGIDFIDDKCYFIRGHDGDDPYVYWIDTTTSPWDINNINGQRQNLVDLVDLPESSNGPYEGMTFDTSSGTMCIAYFGFGYTSPLYWGPEIFEAFELTAVRENAIDKGLEYLRTTQSASGDWNSDVGITAMCVLAFLNYGYTESDPDIDDAMNWILDGGHVHGDGSIYSTYWYRTYQTSLAILSLVAADKTNEPDKYTTYIENAANWLYNSQFDEDEGYTSSHSWYGGFGYEGDDYDRPDLSNTQWALMALAAAGITDDDPLWQKAIIFVERCQNPDGGLQYTPEDSLSSDGSYGSMTAAGIWSYKLCGLSNSDSRVTNALNWFKNYYTWDENPNMRPISQHLRFLYYYYCTIAKALVMMGKTHIIVGGTSHDWYQEMYGKIVSLQHDDGHWVNTYIWHGSEGDPNIATAFALLALETRTLSPGAELWMSIILASYADLHVYDQQGRHTGKIYDQNGDWMGEIEEEIPGSSYEIVNGEQIIDLPQIEAGSYRIELVGTGTGDYKLTVIGKQDGLEVYSESWEGEITDEEVYATDVVVTAMEGALTIFSSPLSIAPVMDVTPKEMKIYAEYGDTIEETFEVSSRFDTTHGITIYATDMEDNYGNIIDGSTFSFTPNDFTVPVDNTISVGVSGVIPVIDGGWTYTGNFIIESSDAGSKSINVMIVMDYIPPDITVVSAVPDRTFIEGYINISCMVTDNIEVNTVNVNISGPDGFSTVNLTMNKGTTSEKYYLNDSYVIPGEYSYFIWANDTNDNRATSEIFTFEVIILGSVDIDPDTLNLNSSGKWITCYIELPDGYDVTDINIGTILLNDVVSAEDHPTNISDYDEDGIPDLMVKFNRQEVQDILEPGENVVITVNGKLFDGTLFEGTDYIRVI